MKKQEILLGNFAIARGLIEAGCSLFTAYPGTPSSEILPGLAYFKEKKKIYLEWSTNEKVAFEVAFGAALTGKRTAVAMKQVGLNVALQSLIHARSIPFRGGFVIVSADDPGPQSSQTEQDTRQLGIFYQLPVLDPANPQEAKEMAKYAFEISEKFHMPVILRTTHRISHARQNVTLGPIRSMRKATKFWKDKEKESLPFEIRLVRTLKGIEREFEREVNFNRTTLKHPPQKKLGIIAAGVSYSIVRDLLEEKGLSSSIPVLKIGTVHPLPREKVEGFMSQFENIFVLEETDAAIEIQLQDKERVFGRWNRILPSEGELGPDVIANALFPLLHRLKLYKEIPAEDIELQQTIQSMKIPPRPPRLCPGCGHRAAFFAIRQVCPNALFPGDIGCYTLGVNMKVVDTCLDMGSSVNFAAGFYQTFHQDEKDYPILATIGDSTYFHTGLSNLLGAVQSGKRFVLIILDNGVVAMTGLQPTPGTGITANKEQGKSISIKGMLEAFGIPFVREVDAYQVEELISLIRQGVQFTNRPDGGIAVIIAKRDCILHAKSLGSFQPLLDRIEATKTCIGCRACINTFDCPALIWNSETRKVSIDESLCIGCGICLYACPQNRSGAGLFSFQQTYFLDHPLSSAT
ncbi:MAG: thiamine pyrophosphate-dependent enzyme [Thermodesulfobacteriota bacterium]